MQLQEEEEDRSRRTRIARRREDELSQAFLSSQSSNSNAPTTNPRNSSRQSIPISSPRTTTSTNAAPAPRTQVVRPLVPPRRENPLPPTPASNPVPLTHRDPEAEEDAPPPSYEQAAKSTPYIPPSGTPLHSPQRNQPPPQPPRPGEHASIPSRGGYPGNGYRGNVSRPRGQSAYASNANMAGPSRDRRSSYGRYNDPGEIIPNVQRRRSAGVTSQQGGDRGRDKDCTIM